METRTLADTPGGKNRWIAPVEPAVPRGRLCPITQEQAEAIGEILRAEYESNSAFRDLVNAKAVALEASSSAIPSNRQTSSALLPAGAGAQGVAA
jgi:hypothetical protein